MRSYALIKKNLFKLRKLNTFVLCPKANEVDAFSTNAKDIYEIAKTATFKIAAAESSSDGMNFILSF